MKTARQGMVDLRQRLRHRRQAHCQLLWRQVKRLTSRAAELGVQQVILVGSLTRLDEPGLTSDLDLLIVWDTPLGFLERTVDLYRRLQPRVATDLLVYTPTRYPNGLPDSIPARVYTQPVAEETARMADLLLDL